VAALVLNFGPEASAAVLPEMSRRLAQAASQFMAGQSLPAGTVTVHAVRIADGALKAMKIKLLATVTLATSLLVTSAGLAAWWAVNGRINATGHPLAAAEIAEPQSPRLAFAGVVPAPVGREADSRSEPPAQLDPRPEPAVGSEIARRPAEEAKVSDSETASRPVLAFPSIRAGDFTITVRQAAFITGTDFVPAPRALRIDRDRLPDESPELSLGRLGSSPRAGHAGLAGSSPKPGIAIDLVIEGASGGNRQRIVELAPEATATDDHGQRLEPSRLPALFGWREKSSAAGGGFGKNRLFLVPNEEHPAEQIATLAGELLITDGEIATVTFSRKELAGRNKKGVTKRSAGTVFTFYTLRRTADGIEVDVSVETPNTIAPVRG